MKFGRTTAQECIRQATLCEWHNWFAWYPVRTLDGSLSWLETVRRKALKFTGRDISWDYISIK